MIYKMRMGDPIEINLVPLGFSFKELSNQIKKFIRKNDVSSTLIPFNSISRLSQICACLTSLINLV